MLKPMTLLPLLFFVYTFFLETGYIYFRDLCYKYYAMIQPDNFIWVKDGVPGSGKSSSALVYVYILAFKVWRDLRQKYWLYKNNPKRLYSDGVSAANWKEIQDAYWFWVRHPEAIPCLMSNISLKLGEMQVMQLNKYHYLQLVKIPYGTVLFGDELDKLFPALNSPTKEERSELEPLRQLMGFTRHFGDFRWIFTSQQSSKIWNGVRDSASNNEYMYSQTWVLRPRLFISIYEFIMRRVEKNGYPDSKILARFMWWFYEFNRKIGFRYYVSEKFGNMEREGVKLKTEKNVYAAPSRLPLEYDDRTFRNSYMAKDLSLEDNKIFNSLIAPPIIGGNPR